MIAFLEYLVSAMMAHYIWAETCCSKTLQHKKSCCDYGYFPHICRVHCVFSTAV